MFPDHEFRASAEGVRVRNHFQPAVPGPIYPAPVAATDADSAAPELGNTGANEKTSIFAASADSAPAQSSTMPTIPPAAASAYATRSRYFASGFIAAAFDLDDVNAAVSPGANKTGALAVQHGTAADPLQLSASLLFTPQDPTCPATKIPVTVSIAGDALWTRTHAGETLPVVSAAVKHAKSLHATALARATVLARARANAAALAQGLEPLAADSKDAAALQDIAQSAAQAANDAVNKLPCPDSTVMGLVDGAGVTVAAADGVAIARDSAPLLLEWAAAAAVTTLRQTVWHLAVNRMFADLRSAANNQKKAADNATKAAREKELQQQHANEADADAGSDKKSSKPVESAKTADDDANTGSQNEGGALVDVSLAASAEADSLFGNTSDDFPLAALDAVSSTMVSRFLPALFLVQYVHWSPRTELPVLVVHSEVAGLELITGRDKVLPTLVENNVTHSDIFPTDVEAEMKAFLRSLKQKPTQPTYVLASAAPSVSESQKTAPAAADPDSAAAGDDDKTGEIADPEAEAEEHPHAPVDPSSWSVPATELAARADLRERIIYSIDPPTARDLDDALSVEPLPDGTFRVGVHIADVSFFVRPGMKVDAEAVYRATSVYLSNFVVPMLPRILCEELCSLNPGVDRLAFSCFFRMDTAGNIIREAESDKLSRVGKFVTETGAPAVENAYKYVRPLGGDNGKSGPKKGGNSNEAKRNDDDDSDDDDDDEDGGAKQRRPRKDQGAPSKKGSGGKDNSAPKEPPRRNLIEDAWFGKSVIRSCIKLDYATAQQLVDCGFDGVDLDSAVAAGKAMPAVCARVGVTHSLRDLTAKTNLNADEAILAQLRGRPDLWATVSSGGRCAPVDQALLPEIVRSARMLHALGMHRRAWRFRTGSLALNRSALAYKYGVEGAAYNAEHANDASKAGTDPAAAGMPNAAVTDAPGLLKTVQSFSRYPMYDANNVIEEFMLLGNLFVAQRISRVFPATSLVRNHPAPNKLEAIVAGLAVHGVEINPASAHTVHDSLQKLTRLQEEYRANGGKLVAGSVMIVPPAAPWSPDAKANSNNNGKKGAAPVSAPAVRSVQDKTAKLMELLSRLAPSGLGIVDALEEIILRGMMRANYICTGNNKGRDDNTPPSSWHHYALNFDEYTHFTSPIRRYPDVAVHRLLEASLQVHLYPTYALIKVSFA